MSKLETLFEVIYFRSQFAFGLVEPDGEDFSNLGLQNRPKLVEISEKSALISE